jgi:hypothetical protein
MSSSAERHMPHPSEAQRAQNYSLWFGILAAPIAWFIDLNVRYQFSSLACSDKRYMWGVHGATVLALIIVVAAFIVSWREWRAAGEETPSGAGQHQARVRFMAICAVATCLSFTLVIIAEAIPSWVLGPCQ